MADDKTAGLRRRFYETVSVQGETAPFGVTLDGRPVKTPGRLDLAVQTAPLAAAIADEWDAQAEHIRPHTMPLTQIACTAIERVAAERAEIEKGIARYAETDLVCYRAETPADLAERQAKHWQPALDWLAASHSVRLAVTTSILPTPQDHAALDRVAEMLRPYDPHELAVVSVLTQATNSVVLALAVVEGALDVDAATEAAQLDEDYQKELWGLDREAEIRLQALRADIAAADRYLALHRS